MQNFDALRISATVDLHMEGLRRLRSMWLDPKALYYEDDVPKKGEGVPTIFLAGPTSRDGIPDYMWRKDAVFYLRNFGYIGQILIPEFRGCSYLSNKNTDDFTEGDKIHQWEYDGIDNATALAFWIPRNLEQLLGITTNREYGKALERAKNNKKFSNNLFIGWPDNAKKMGSMDFELRQAKVGRKEGEHYTSLKELCKDLSSIFRLDCDIPC